MTEKGNENLQNICLTVIAAQFAFAIASAIIKCCCPCLPCIPTKRLTCCFGVLASIIWIVVTALLCYGVLKLNKDYLIPWVVFASVAILFYLILFIVSVVKMVKGEKLCVNLMNVLINFLAIVGQVISLTFILMFYFCLDENRSCGDVLGEVEKKMKDEIKF